MTPDAPKGSGAPGRSAARLAAVQALYQMELTGLGVEAAIREFREFRLGGGGEDDLYRGADRKFFADILRAAVEVQARLDVYLTGQLSTGWTLARIDPIARAALRCALCELVRKPKVPSRVVIDEYVTLAADFLSDQDVKFVNAVLAGAASEARRDEWDIERAGDGAGAHERI